MEIMPVNASPSTSFFMKADRNISNDIYVVATLVTFALSANDETGEHLWYGCAHSQERQSHGRVRHAKGKTDNCDHPRDHVGDGSNPGHANNE